MLNYILIPFAKKAAKMYDLESTKAIEIQERIFKYLLNKGKKTKFGIEHKFGKIRNYDDYCNQVPIRDYDEIEPYIERIILGEQNVLWEGLPIYFAKSSGTTSDVKFIPLSNESLRCHLLSSRNIVLNRAAEMNDYKMFGGKVMFISATSNLSKTGNIPTARLSGIVNSLAPWWIRQAAKPSANTNLITNWEERLQKIIEETHSSDLRIIGGFPPWIKIYFEELIQFTGKKTIREIFPNFSLLIHSGMNFEPYRKSFTKLIGDNSIYNINAYSASEGFFAFQDKQNKIDLLLNVNGGIFFEFLRVENLKEKSPKIISIKEVQIGIDYILIVSTNAGLWRYNTGDTVRFTSIHPFKIIFTGRAKQFISAFGEHVTIEQIESAINYINNKNGLSINEFTIAPKIITKRCLPHHEWYIEFDINPETHIIKNIEKQLDDFIISKNIDYQNLISSKVLSPLKIIPIPKNTLTKYLNSIEKGGGQYKIPRVSNDRNLVNKLLKRIKKGRAL